MKSDYLADFPGYSASTWKDAQYSSATGPYLFYAHADGGPGGSTAHEAVFGTGMQSHGACGPKMAARTWPAASLCKAACSATFGA